MKSILSVVLFSLFSVSALADDVSVGVSIAVGQPGFYGQIVLGNAPAPVLIFPQPILIVPGPVLPPIYLYVPFRHAHNWRIYCHYYNACGRQVYFVQHGWYNNVYVPYYHRHRNEYQEREHREFRDHGRYHYYDRSRERERRTTPRMPGAAPHERRPAPQMGPRPMPQERRGQGGGERRDRGNDRH